MIYLIFKATKIAGSMQKEWVEPFIMRFAGGVIVVFSIYSMYQALSPASAA
jgi:nickel/cobalt exporter